MKNPKYDYSKLKSKIVEKYGTQKEFIGKIDMASTTFIQKLKSNKFNQQEIEEIVTILDIPLEEIPEYFFSIKS
ncbi:MAG: DUF739 family protein [Bacilli bacterium]|nr:DUF739 family protein [Bacilli bacterium]